MLIFKRKGFLQSLTPLSSPINSNNSLTSTIRLRGVWSYHRLFWEYCRVWGEFGDFARLRAWLLGMQKNNLEKVTLIFDSGNVAFLYWRQTSYFNIISCHYQSSHLQKYFLLINYSNGIIDFLGRGRFYSIDAFKCYCPTSPTSVLPPLKVL